MKKSLILSSLLCLLIVFSQANANQNDSNIMTAQQENPQKRPQPSMNGNPGAGRPSQPSTSSNEPRGQRPQSSMSNQRAAQPPINSMNNQRPNQKPMNNPNFGNDKPGQRLGQSGNNPGAEQRRLARPRINANENHGQRPQSSMNSNSGAQRPQPGANNNEPRGQRP